MSTAREESLRKVQAQAPALDANDVLGLYTYIYDLGGGLVEFLVIGTAVKRVPGLTTRSEQLPQQVPVRHALFGQDRMGSVLDIV